MSSHNSTRRYTVAVITALAVLVVMTVGALLNAGFNAHYIL